MQTYWQKMVGQLIVSAMLATFILSCWLIVSFGFVGYDFFSSSALESAMAVIKLKGTAGWLFIFSISFLITRFGSSMIYVVSKVSNDE